MFFVNARALIEREGSSGLEVVVQIRNKSGEPQKIELPGGRVEPYESLTTALRREVKEETGLNVVEIEGEDTRIDTVGVDPEFEVECLQPFAAYQTIKGPIDSTGLYFRCKAEGQLLDAGDETKGIRWINVKNLAQQMKSDPLQFSNVDCAGIKFYLKQIGAL